MIASSLTAFLNWVLLLPVLYLSGARLASFAKEDHFVLRGILNFACGLGILGFYLVLVGGFHLLKPEAVLIYIFAVLALGCRKLPEFGRWFVSLFKYLFEKGDGFYRGCQAIFVVSLVLTFTFCFLPEITHDALSYQLPLAKLFARRASTAPWEYDLNSYMPLLMNVIYSVGLLFQSVATDKLFQWFCGFLLVAAITVVFEKETRSKPLASFTALMFWLTPAVAHQITIAYVDVASGFFVFLFFYCFVKGMRVQETGGFFVSGFLLGLAVSTKFLILVLLLPASIVLGWYLWRAAEKKQAAAGASLFFTGVFLGCGYWFVRNGLLLKNPFYPYLGELFGTGGISNLQVYWSVGIPKTGVNYFLLPWLLTFYPQSFSASFDWIGPYYLCVLPSLFFVRDKKRVAVHLIFLIYFLTAFFFILQVVRYLIIILPIYLWAAALGLSDAALRFPARVRQWARTAGGILAALLLLLVCYHYRFQSRVLLGIWSPEEYLLKMERSYSAAQWINGHLPEDAVVLNAGEARQFYFRPRMIREVMLFRRTNYPENFAKKGTLAYFRQLGITHVLRGQSLDLPATSDAHIQELDEELNHGKQARLLVTLDSKNIREARYRYRVYELKGVP